MNQLDNFQFRSCPELEFILQLHFIYCFAIACCELNLNYLKNSFRTMHCIPCLLSERSKFHFLYPPANKGLVHPFFLLSYNLLYGTMFRILWIMHSTCDTVELKTTSFSINSIFQYFFSHVMFLCYNINHYNYVMKVRSSLKEW